MLRATPADVAAGVRVGDPSFPAFPGTAVGPHRPGAAGGVLRAALRPGRRPRRSSVFARDEAGNEATATLDRQPFPKTFQRSRIPIDKRVPRRASCRPSPPTRRRWAWPPGAGDDLLAAFLVINRDLRQQNNPPSPRSPPRPRPRCAGPRRSRSSATRRSSRGSPITAPTSTRARKSTSRRTSASTWPRRAGAGHRRQPRRGRARRVSRHLRQLRRRRPRAGRAVALRAPVVDGREGGRHGRQGPDARPLGHDRAGRRRPPALHDARRRRAGESGGVVGRPLDGRPRVPQNPRGRRHRAGGRRRRDDRS